MPWLETSPMEQRERFIDDHRLDLYTMTELCERYDISRKTGYKWLDRFDEAGVDGAVGELSPPQERLRTATRARNVMSRVFIRLPLFLVPRRSRRTPG